jgi:hypothetical protein
MVQIFIKIRVFFVQACLNNNGPIPSVLLVHLGLPLVQFHFVFLRCHGGSGGNGGSEAVRSGSGCGGGGVGFSGAVGIGGAVCGGVSSNPWNAAVLVRTCYQCPAVVAPPPSSLMTDSVLLLISACTACRCRWWVAVKLSFFFCHSIF